MNKKNSDHSFGELEHNKFDYRRKEYLEFCNYVEKLKEKPNYIWENYPLFAGDLTLTRFLFLHDIYKRTRDVAGHICEIGTFNGTSAAFFGKLVSIYEPKSLTLVHTFDHFKGMQPNKSESNFIKDGGYKSNEETVRKLIDLQNLSHIVKIHNIDILLDLKTFLKEKSHLMFKIIFLDAGVKDVTKTAIKELWPRLVPGGICVFDQFSFELAPGETEAIRQLLPKQKIRSATPSWMPNAFVIKE